MSRGRMSCEWFSEREFGKRKEKNAERDSPTDTHVSRDVVVSNSW